MTVLVIEHDAAELAMMKAALEGEGYKVLASDNAREGVNLAFEQTPAMIFLDSRVRGGFDLAIQEEASAPQFKYSTRWSGCAANARLTCRNRPRVS